MLDNTMGPFLRKRIHFQFESEMRLVHFDGSAFGRKAETPSGLKIAVDLEPLIQEVFVSPFAEKADCSIVEEVLKQAKLSKVKVVHSQLFMPPA